MLQLIAKHSFWDVMVFGIKLKKNITNANRKRNKRGDDKKYKRCFASECRAYEHLTTIKLISTNEY